MRIVVVGAGVVGFHLAERLSGEGHDIHIVDADPVLVRRIDERLNVQAILGDASSPSVLKRADAEGADLVIAVTNRDDTNIVVSLLARKLGAKKCVVRLRKTELSSKDSILDPESIGASLVVNPVETTAELLRRLINTPGSFDVAEFSEGDLLLWGFEISKESPLDRLPLRDLRERYKAELNGLIVAIARPNGELVIPRGDDELRTGDHIYVFIHRKATPEFRKLIHPEADRVERVVISGATQLGIEVARMIEGRIKSVVLVETEMEKAEIASNCLTKTLVLHGQISDPDFVRENNIGDADYFLGLDDDDQQNLMNALLVKKLGVPCRVVKSQQQQYLPILQSLDVGEVVNPRLITVSAILRHIRKGRVTQVSQVGESGAEAREYLVTKDAAVCGKAIRDMKVPSGALIGAVQHKDQVVIAQGDTVIEPGDHVVIFALPEAVEKVERLFTKRKVLRS
ncbi:MAG TPA: Trk system potassium transporter TrkA [Planctomycetes bacterium]|nr:Trk system potassium transporter TrkA [Planctomycetota bacterium]HIN80697.1 Trk system potassium transporter TrkA [Planctomycetota bacterium]